MNKSLLALLSTTLLLSPLANAAGVVMEMTGKDASGELTERTMIYALKNRIRMDDVELDGEAVESSMIFLGDRFLYVDHEDKSYIVMDETMLDQVSSKIDEAMKEMEKQLAGMPPEQRAMVEQMMKGQMPGMMDEPDARAPAHKIKAMGKSKWRSYDCRQYAVFEGAEKTQEVCAADLDEIDSADDVMSAFRSMAAYMTKMTESLPMGSDEDVNPVELMDQMEGFPVHTVEYRNGRVVSETSLESVVEQDLDKKQFAAPEGYRRQDPFATP